MTKPIAVLVLLLGLLMTGCSALRLRPVEQRITDPRTEAEESINPLGFKQDREIITQQEYGNQSKAQAKLEERKTRSESDSLGIKAYEYVTVYRVQVYASKNRSQAEAFADSIETVFTREKVHTEYQAPYYRVRVGDCKSFDEAEELLNRVEKTGFKEAWVVKARVRMGSGENET